MPGQRTLKQIIGPDICEVKNFDALVRIINRTQTSRAPSALRLLRFRFYYSESEFEVNRIKGLCMRVASEEAGARGSSLDKPDLRGWEIRGRRPGG